MSSQPEFKYIPIDQLKLDPQNPRLPKSFRNQSPSEKQLIEYMLEDESIIELMLSIGQNGFFEGEQLLVVPEDDGTYRVIEGNRRLTATKLLRQPELSSVFKNRIAKAIEEITHKPKQIPCLEFEHEDDIHERVGFRHITGIKEWRLLERARYLHALWKTKYSDLSPSVAARELAKSVGSNADRNKRILVAFEMYSVLEDHNFYKIRGLDDDSRFHLNYYVDALQNSRPHISSWLQIDKNGENPLEKLDEEKFEKLNRVWFEENRALGDSHDLNALDKILNPDNAPAQVAFFEERVSLIRALELTGEKDERFEKSINQALEALEDANQLSHKVKIFYPAWSDDIKTIEGLVRSIKFTVEGKIENEKND